jgi:hypothetical protein
MRTESPLKRGTVTGIKGTEMLVYFIFGIVNNWPHDLRRVLAAPPLLGLRGRIRRGHVGLSLVSVVYYQVEVSTTG